MNSRIKSFSLLGIRVSYVSEQEVLEYIYKGLKNYKKKLFLVTLNPEIIIFARQNKRFRDIINSASLALPDGVGVIWAEKILGRKLKKRVTGIETMEKLCKMAAKEGFTIGLIGGRGNVAERTAECLRKKYPGLEVALVTEEWKNIPKNKTIDMLFVALGFPKQEFWISENLPKIPARMAMGVGGAFDFISGNISRAPKLVQDLGFEWLFRLILEPWRWHRQLALIEFALLVLKERVALLTGKSNTI